MSSLQVKLFLSILIDIAPFPQQLQPWATQTLFFLLAVQYYQSEIFTWQFRLVSDTFILRTRFSWPELNLLIEIYLEVKPRIINIPLHSRQHETLLNNLARGQGAGWREIDQHIKTLISRSGTWDTWDKANIQISVSAGNTLTDSDHLAGAHHNNV